MQDSSDVLTCDNEGTAANPKLCVLVAVDFFVFILFWGAQTFALWTEKSRYKAEN